MAEKLKKIKKSKKNQSFIKKLKKKGGGDTFLWHFLKSYWQELAIMNSNMKL